MESSRRALSKSQGPRRSLRGSAKVMGSPKSLRRSPKHSPASAPQRSGALPPLTLPVRPPVPACTPRALGLAFPSIGLAFRPRLDAWCTEIQARRCVCLLLAGPCASGDGFHGGLHGLRQAGGPQRPGETRQVLRHPHPGGHRGGERQVAVEAPPSNFTGSLIASSTQGSSGLPESWKLLEIKNVFGSRCVPIPAACSAPATRPTSMLT